VEESVKMQNKLFLFCLVVVVILAGIAPVSATTINLSLIATPSDLSTSSIDTYTCSGDASSPCIYTAPSGYTIYTMSLSGLASGVYYITYYFADGTSMASTCIYESTSIYSGQLTEWMGSNSQVDSYYVIPGISYIWSSLPKMYTGIDQGTGIRYIVTTINLKQTTYTTGYLYQFNDTESAYEILPASLSTNPITSMRIYTISGGTFNSWAESQTVTGYASAEEIALETETTLLDSLGLGNLQDVIDVILDGLNTLISVMSSIASLLSALLTVSTLIFASGLFVGFNALYVAFAILLAIEDSDDIFRAFGSFMRRMNKLLKFYMELYAAIKKIVLAWT
jgi:hypothetical protein